VEEQPLNEEISYMQNRPISSRIIYNVIGGSLTLLSLQLPWLTFNVIYTMTLQPGGLYMTAFYWILAGSILSFISRYGGVFTLIGFLAFIATPYGYFGSGPGLLLAFVGALFTFAGARSSIPFYVVKGREVMGGILYSIGFLILLTLTVSMFVYGNFVSAFQKQLIVQLPLVLVGVFMTGLGLRMYLSQEKNQSPIERLNPLT